MKIGFDVSDLSTARTDGTTRYTTELAKRLPLLAPNDSWNYYAPADFMPDQTWPVNVIKRISYWPKYWTQMRLPFNLCYDKPDVLFMPIQQIPYARPRKTKTIAVVHDLAVHSFPEQFTYKDWALLQVFSAYVAREADHIIAVSQATAHDIEKYYGRTKNVHVVHHGVDHNRFRLPSDAEKEEGMKELTQKYPALKKPYIFYVGQIQPRKNIVRLVEAFELLKETRQDLQLVIAGGHGWLKKPIIQRIESSKYKDSIVLTGCAPDSLLPTLYWHAEIFVLPSLYEGFGMPVLEAMACGCPVVTSNASSLPEVAGDAAVLVNPIDIASIKEGVEKALVERQSLITRGLERSKQFTWDKTARETLAVINMCR